MSGLVRFSLLPTEQIFGKLLNLVTNILSPIYAMNVTFDSV